jgi:hypothetical protein
LGGGDESKREGERENGLDEGTRWKDDGEEEDEDDEEGTVEVAILTRRAVEEKGSLDLDESVRDDMRCIVGGESMGESGSRSGWWAEGGDERAIRVAGRESSLRDPSSFRPRRNR